MQDGTTNMLIIYKTAVDYQQNNDVFETVFIVRANEVFGWPDQS